MLAIIKTTVLHGIEGQFAQVEVDVSNGFPGFEIVGLPDTAVREAKDRVRTAIKNSGFDFPVKKITVNLAPADVKKEGPIYDLPIAAGILAATEQVPLDNCSPYFFLGELSLNGEVRGITGVLPNILACGPDQKVIVPFDNAGEAALVPGVRVYPVTCLVQMVRFLNGEEDIPPFQVNLAELTSGLKNKLPDMIDIRGQAVARRALEVAAAGGHNILMIGSPGSGKTMLARRLPGILPGLSLAEAMEVTKIYSLAGLLASNQPLILERPFRAPHHTSSTASLVGGGRLPRPGEISLAHQGVLFLDEIPEFPKDALEALRQPLEDGLITVSRALATYTYPARIMLVGAMNPCPCGFFGDPEKECTCTPHQVQRYINRLSGPLLDRIDLHIEVPRLTYSEMAAKEPGKPSAEIKKRVLAARQRQHLRFGLIPDSSDLQNRSPILDEIDSFPRVLPEDKAVFELPFGSNQPARPLVSCNAQMEPADVRRFCLLSKEARTFLQSAFKQLNLSARAHDRILKVALTIADLAESEIIEAEHIAEAVHYRSLDRKY